jgi:hypothetical protein
MEKVRGCWDRDVAVAMVHHTRQGGGGGNNKLGKGRRWVQPRERGWKILARARHGGGASNEGAGEKSRTDDRRERKEIVLESKAADCGPREGINTLWLSLDFSFPLSSSRSLCCTALFLFVLFLRISPSAV